uniref:lymphocyte expansion molecule n=1 Tax=Euleptes europaea TaxID=460621 RepID=UPI002540FC01|nr:lymphocyte expansion molecule [Euleptes europaea]
MEPKGFTGAPFGSQAARFDVSAIYPDVKKPSTYLQAPYSKTVCSDLNRRLGPGTYSVDQGGFSSISMQKLSFSNWAKAQEATRLTEMPHFNFKEICKKGKLLKQKLGPGTYNYKDFLELQQSRPCSMKGACETGEARFKARIRECYPGPGTYGNPYTCLEEKEKRSVTALGIMDSKTAKCLTFLNTGSGLGPGTYNLKNGMDEMLQRVVSIRGPYDTFTGDRSKPIICGHHATEKTTVELGKGKIKSFLEELESKEKKKHGVFSSLARNPVIPPERLFWETVGQCPRTAVKSGPGSYDLKPIKRSEFENQPPFWTGSKRFDRKTYRLLFGNANPVGVGRYDVMKHEKYPKKIRYRSLYMNDAQRYLNDLERDKCLQERITPVNKGQYPLE